MKRSTIKLVAKLLDRCLPLMACLSGVVVVDHGYLRAGTASAGMPPYDGVPPDLDSQLDEILDTIMREEQKWRLDSRIID